ncbi:MAG TPA: nucleotidyltransferase family protein, partial [Armatimonadota bacterium]|nr:nucleotidyltransferase family protein [Armatimonadota bacterium]
RKTRRAFRATFARPSRPAQGPVLPPMALRRDHTGATIGREADGGTLSGPASRNACGPNTTESRLAPPAVVAIILAAGGATRLGGRPKPLLPVDGVPMVQRVLAAVRAAPSIGRIIVVLGHRADEVAAALAGSPARLVTNPEYRTGRTSSIRCGLRQCPEDVAGVLLLHADQPFVEAGLIETLARAIANERAPAAAVAVGDELATPFAFGAAMLPRLRALADGEGPCMLLRELDSAVARIRVDDPRVVADIDCLEDYRTWTADTGEPRLP